jgi:hypothetical protein
MAKETILYEEIIKVKNEKIKQLNIENSYFKRILGFHEKSLTIRFYCPYCGLSDGNIQTPIISADGNINKQDETFSNIVIRECFCNNCNGKFKIHTNVISMLEYERLDPDQSFICKDGKIINFFKMKF